MNSPAADTPIAATLSAAEADAVLWDAVVIGAGPAGGAAAVRLATRGMRVLLIDAASMPRPKLCGCCLSTAAVGELALLEHIMPARFDAGRAGLPRPLPLERVRLTTAEVTAALPLPGGGVISREALDTATVRGAIAAGAAWLPETRVTAITETAAAARVEVSPCGSAGGNGGPQALSTRIVVVAAGLADTVRTTPTESPGRRLISTDSRLGLGGTLPPDAGGPPRGELVMAVSRRGYCGVVRLEDGRIDIAAAVDRSLVAEAGGPASAVAGILAESGGSRAARLPADLASLLGAAAMRATPPLTRRRPVGSRSGRILRVGDAAGYVEPFTGEGMGWALASARLLDEALAAEGRLTESPSRAAVRYADAYRRHFAAHHARCRRVALAVRRPWLVTPALRLARLAPTVAARFVPLMVGAAAPKQAHG